MEEYDAVIVGAGPAGANCARKLAKLGHSVLLIERSKIIGIPNFSSGGTPNETMKVFRLPKKVTYSAWNSILIASKNERAEFLYKKRMGYILNYMRLKQFLAKDAKKHGADILTGVHVDDVVVKNNFVCGVTFHEGVEKKIFAKVVVDATGGRATLSQKLGLLKADKKKLAVGIEYHMKNVELERKERIDFYFGSAYVPGGYAWIFPIGLTKAKVGLCALKLQKAKIDLKKLLEKFAAENPQTKNSIQTDLHSGSVFANGGIKNHTLNGFIAIGDAAGQINPLSGEGIRHALYSGFFAAEVIDAALQKNRVDKKSLDAYNERWKKYVGNKWKNSLRIQHILYNASIVNDAVIDEFVKFLKTMDPEDIFEIAFNYRFELAKKYFPGILKLISKNFFGDVV
jgi:digeranylgeranylglycerophospholipid reductase